MGVSAVFYGVQTEGDTPLHYIGLHRALVTPEMKTGGGAHVSCVAEGELDSSDPTTSSIHSDFDSGRLTPSSTPICLLICSGNCIMAHRLTKFLVLKRG